MSDNVTSLPSASGLPENPMQLAPRPLGWCDHESIVLDEHTRTVTCANPKCGAALDPFDFLAGNARTIQRAWSAYRSAMNQANEVAERVSVLKKEEQRLRAMVKRLQEKTGSVVSTRGRDL